MSFLEDMMHFFGYSYADPSRLDKDHWRRQLGYTVLWQSCSSSVLAYELRVECFLKGGKKKEVMIQSRTLTVAYNICIKCATCLAASMTTQDVVLPNQLASLICG